MYQRKKFKRETTRYTILYTKCSLISQQPSDLWFFHGPLEEAISGVSVCARCLYCMCCVTLLTHTHRYTYTHIQSHYNNRITTKATTYLQIRRRKVVLERTLEACWSLPWRVKVDRTYLKSGR